MWHTFQILMLTVFNKEDAAEAREEAGEAPEVDETDAQVTWSHTCPEQRSINESGYFKTDITNVNREICRHTKTRLRSPAPV